MGVLGEVSDVQLWRGGGVCCVRGVLTRSGVLCEYRISKEDAVLSTPAGMTDEETCTLTVVGITTWMSMNGQRPLGSPGGNGEVVLIQGTGGVSINGLQIAKAAGATGNASPFFPISVILMKQSDHHVLLRREACPCKRAWCRPHHQLQNHT